jgi:sulfate adenylyltransferase subunit 2
MCNMKSKAKLNRQQDPLSLRKAAVQLRQSGSTIDHIQKVTGLSAPTIIALNKAYQAGGLQAVIQRKVGRPCKTSKDINSQGQWWAVWKQLFQEKTQQLWTFDSLVKWLAESQNDRRGNFGSCSKPINKRSAMRLLEEWGWLPNAGNEASPTILKEAAQKKFRVFVCANWELPNIKYTKQNYSLLYAKDLRGKLFWGIYKHPLVENSYVDFCQKLLEANPLGIALELPFAGLSYTPNLAAWAAKNNKHVLLKDTSNPASCINTSFATSSTQSNRKVSMATDTLQNPPEKSELGLKSLTHLQQLEAESIYIMREVMAEADNPVMLYSIGKDSAVMLHLALKAFYPAPLPFPLLHVDTGWKFRDMYAFRDQMKKEHGFELLIHMNLDGVAQGINPFTHGSQIHTDIMKTQGLKQALEKYRFDVAFGGARRDEEKSRAKERIFSFRNSQHRWDPKQQRPELWSLYNTKKNKGESIRVFPISNWTELDIWQYIYLENIPIVPLYFAKERPVVERDGTLIMVDDGRMPLAHGEIPMIKKVRFRTLGCYPLTGAVKSQADTLPQIIQEMLLTKTSERQGRVIDNDGAASMEKKKQEGYF